MPLLISNPDSPDFPQTSQQPEAAQPPPPSSEATSEQPKPQPQAPSKDEAAKTEQAAKDEAAAAAEAARVEAARAAYALRQQERQLQARHAELEARAKQLEEADAARKAREAEESQLDEIALLEAIAKRKGTTLDAVVRGAIARVQNGGQATVEQQIAEAKAAAEEAKAEAKRLREEAEAARAQEAEAARAAEAEARINAFRDAYAGGIDENHHPFLSMLNPADVAERGLYIANAYALETGRIPATEEVLEYLEGVERTAFEDRATKVGWTKAQAAAAAAAAAGAQPSPTSGVDTSDNPAPASGGLLFGHSADGMPGAGSQGVTRDTAGRFVPRAVTNSAASARGAAPVDWRNMSERDRIAAAGREVFGGGTGR